MNPYMNNFIFYPPTPGMPVIAGPTPGPGPGPGPATGGGAGVIIPGVMQPPPPTTPTDPPGPPPDPPKPPPPPPPKFVQGKPRWNQPREQGKEGAQVNLAQCIIS
ncbi:hypothetical protein BDA99DRAFT_604396 [Phascolomyces articulosus]|uniref:Uncharacterized protein n=1 Tax=Phascolomyces articulosus TaxID=60185 RepID=A0AAD5PEN2_9FUNG|nr:hypothetical protein BDA99DRAFT_604396 [Phascolomyces articulosus]